MCLRHSRQKRDSLLDCKTHRDRESESASYLFCSLLYICIISILRAAVSGKDLIGDVINTLLNTDQSVFNTKSDPHTNSDTPYERIREEEGEERPRKI